MLLWHWCFLNEHIFERWCSELWPHTSVSQTPVGSIYHNLWYLTGEDNTLPCFSSSGWNRILITSHLINRRTTFISSLRSRIVIRRLNYLNRQTPHGEYFFCSTMIDAEAGYGHCSCYDARWSRFEQSALSLQNFPTWDCNIHILDTSIVYVLNEWMWLCHWYPSISK